MFYWGWKWKRKDTKLWIYLEGKETIGYADTITDIKRIAKHWIENVAEEAAIFYYPFDKASGKYKFSDRVFLETY